MYKPSKNIRMDLIQNDRKYSFIIGTTYPVDKRYIEERFPETDQEFCDLLKNRFKITDSQYNTLRSKTGFRNKASIAIGEELTDFINRNYSVFIQNIPIQITKAEIDWLDKDCSSGLYECRHSAIWEIYFTFVSKEVSREDV